MHWHPVRMAHPAGVDSILSMSILPFTHCALPALILLSAASMSGCVHREQTEITEETLEVDNSVIVHEEVVDDTGPESHAIAEVAGGVLVVLGGRLVYVSDDGKRVVKVAEASRIHDSLTADDTYVYFATQLADRASFLSPARKQRPEDADGRVYRVRKSAPFEPEEVTPVNILTGRLEVSGGRLFVCESEGADGASALLEVPLDAPALAVRWAFRPREYCLGVIADDASLTMLVDRSHRAGLDAGTADAEPRLVLASAPRKGRPWDPQLGPKTVTMTEESNVSAFFPRGDELVIQVGARVSTYARNGKLQTTTSAPSGVLLAIPIRGGWVWAKSPESAGNAGGTCRGGRLYAGQAAEGWHELTQSVCTPKAMLAGSAALWLLEASRIRTGANTRRYRLKRLPLPTP